MIGDEQAETNEARDPETSGPEADEGRQGRDEGIAERHTGKQAPDREGSAERSPEGASAAVPSRSGASSNRYTVGEKLEALRAFAGSGQTLREFCRRAGLNTKSFCQWRKEFATLGEAGLRPRFNVRNTGGHSGRVIPADERRALIEAYLRLKLPQATFARTYGISVASLGNWLRRYRESGPKGLEPKVRGRKPGSGAGKPRIAAPVVEQIIATKQRFPHFGMRRVKDYLRRFFGFRVSAGGVRSALKAKGIEPAPALKRRRRGPDLVRRFERALPMDLWQSDITSYVLRRTGTRVYLTVFLDDFSRYVVAYALRTRQTSALVCDSLLAGIASFGKPKEVLTDQGRQYFAWRGKSRFQKLLDREGIRHVVSRAHHPETLGKCERLWKTVGSEFWERAKPQTLEDARERLAHFIAHYNHFRPHQGLDGLVPADRFFGSERTVRDSIEERHAAHELDLALREPPRRTVYLMGQVGEHKLSLHARQGRVEIHTENGLLEEMSLEEAGIAKPRIEAEDEHEEQGASSAVGGAEHAGDGAADGGIDTESEADATRAQAALSSDATSGDRGAGPVGGGECRGAVEGQGDGAVDSGVVGRQDEQGGGGAAVEPASAPSVAALAAGGVGSDRGSPDPAADAQQACGECGRPLDADEARRSRERHGGAAARGEAAQAGALRDAAGECASAPIPGAEEGGDSGCENVAEEVEARTLLQDDAGPDPTTRSASEHSCARERSDAESGECWPGAST